MNGLPADWTIEPLENLANFVTGRTPARANSLYWEGGEEKIPWVAISDMENFGVITSTKESITKKAFDEVFRNRIVRAGTLIMSFKLTIGRVATLGIDACHNEAIISLYPRNRIDQRFLGYFLSQVDWDDHQDRQIKGNTLNQDKINRIPIALPSSSEQSDIANVLDRVRTAVALETKAEQVAQRLKGAAMRQTFSAGLRGESQKETALGLVPEGWDVRPLGDVCALSTGTTPSTKRVDYYQGDTAFIKTGEIVNNRLSRATTFVSSEAVRDYNLQIYPAGTVLMAMYGQGKTRGQVALLEIPATTTQNAGALQPSDRLSPTFLWHYLLSIYDRLRGMGSLGHLSHLNLGYLRELLIVCPPLDEQAEIVVILDALDRQNRSAQAEAGRSRRAVQGPVAHADDRRNPCGRSRSLGALTSAS